MPFVDIVFGNESEAEAYGTANGASPNTPATVARMIADLPKENSAKPRIVIITQGALPSIVAIAGQETYEVAVPPVPEEEITDSNGAGDAFCGGFLSQYVQGKSVRVCCEAGNYTASQIIRVSGCVVPSFAATFTASE